MKRRALLKLPGRAAAFAVLSPVAPPALASGGVVKGGNLVSWLRIELCDSDTGIEWREFPDIIKLEPSQSLHWIVSNSPEPEEIDEFSIWPGHA